MFTKKLFFCLGGANRQMANGQIGFFFFLFPFFLSEWESGKFSEGWTFQSRFLGYRVVQGIPCEISGSQIQNQPNNRFQLT